MSKIKVLYVEDHVDTREVITEVLIRQGFEIITAVDCKSGIALGASEAFDVLLCDIALPDGDGTEVADTLHALKSFPAVAVTGHACNGRAQQLVLRSFDECLTKPFKMSDLIKLIEKVYFEAQVVQSASPAKLHSADCRLPELG